MAGSDTSYERSYGDMGSGYTRAQNLMRAGFRHERAWQSATNGRGPWWNGGSSHMYAAYTQSWFDHQTLVSLLATQQRLSFGS